jgi:hypothetical protein
MLAMKSKVVKYSIKEPCHVDWSEMKPEAKGRFCESCSKTVVDFSSMSDFSIVNYLESHKNQSICGRFEEKQLERTYLLPKQHYSTFTFDLKAVALGLALSTFSAIPSDAQNVTKIEQIDSVSEAKIMMKGDIAMVYDHSKETFASGKIELEGKEFKMVNISLIDGNSKEIQTIKLDKNGAFNIPLDWSKNPVSIQISALGYYSQTIYFSNYRSLEKMNIHLHEKGMIKGKVSR